jgi:mediator of RNA polymerase II transcription subunit 12
MLAHRDKTPLPPGAVARGMGFMYGQGAEKLVPFVFRQWEMLSEPNPNIGENDTSLSLTLFEATKIL